MSVRRWIKQKSNEQWQKVLDRENTTVLSSTQAKINAIVPPGKLPTSPIDWNIYVSDDTITKMLQAKNWLHPDIARKYKQALESMLSYSHGGVGSTSLTTLPPQIPTLSDEYEIAYLGLPASLGADFSQAEYSRSMEAYHAHMREIE